MSLATNISDVVTSIATKIKELRTWVNGNDGTGVSRLDTASTNLVDAINEVKLTADSAAGGGVAIDDDNVSTTTTYSSDKIEDVVDTAVTNLVGTAPEVLDTLGELADALGDNENFASTMTTQLAAKAPLASPSLTGTPTAPTAAPLTSTTQLATTGFVQQELGDYTTTTFVQTFEAGLDA